MRLWKKSSSSGGEVEKEIYVRVDDRLIHGQVVHGWVPHLNIDTIVVADDRVASDTLQQKILSLSVPPEIEVCYSSVSELLKIIPRCKGKRILLLLSRVGDLSAAIRDMKVRKINLGNYHPSEGNIVKLSSFFCCTDEELKQLKEIAREGIDIEIQNLPDEKAEKIYYN